MMRSAIRISVTLLLLHTVLMIMAGQIVNTSWFWHALEVVPDKARGSIDSALVFLLYPIQPDGVDEQEQQLEVFVAWFFCGLATLLVSLAAKYGWQAIKYGKNG